MKTTTVSSKLTVTCDYCGSSLGLKVISWGSRHSCYNCFECKKHL